MRRKIFSINIFVMFMLALLWRPSWLMGAELRPFELPSSRNSEQMQRRDLQQSVPETPSVYQQFAEDVRRMTPEQKQQFRDRYQQLYSEAVRNGNEVEMNYYNDLLGILNQ